MKLRVFCVRDRATVQFGTPMFLVTVGQAVRGFADELNRKDAQNQLASHPEDFDLYELGEWDTESGGFECGVPRQVAIGKDLVMKQ